MVDLSAKGGDRPRRVEKVSEDVARQIVRDVSARNLSSGDRLPAEAAMMAEYGVARGTLREALRILEVQGLIYIKPGPKGGPVVGGDSISDFARTASLHLQFTGATMRELAQARLVIEPVMARLAAQNRDEMARDRLQGAVARAAAGELSDDDTFAALSRDFHGTVASMSGNRVLDLFGRALKEMFDARIKAAVTPTSRRAAVRQVHEDIVVAIVEGDGDLAERLMRDHMLAFVQDVNKRHPALIEERISWG